MKKDTEDSAPGRPLFASQVAYIEALQRAVEKGSTEAQALEGRFVGVPTKELHATVEAANEKLRRELHKLDRPVHDFRLGAGGTVVASELTAGRPITLCVTTPTPAVISAEAPRLNTPHRVEFFRTRRRADGVAETRLLGTVKYPDGDGKRNLAFQTERFAGRQSEPLVLHGELIDGNGFLLAAHAVAVSV